MYKLLGQETGLKIIEEASSEHRRPPSGGNRFKKPAILRPCQFLIEVLKMKPGARVVAIAAEPLVETQRIQHEFKRQVRGGDVAAIA